MIAWIFCPQKRKYGECVMKKEIFGTREWADKSYNVISGCSHDCIYCYAKNTALRFYKTTVETWKEESERDRKPVIGRAKRVMFPTAHDITPEHLALNLEGIATVLGRGHEILIVSKPHLACIKAICEKFADFKDRILFRFTIGSASNTILKFWEPNAPSFEERLEALKYAFECGFETSVSCEPMLDENIHRVVAAVRDHVTDSIWIGKMNNCITRVTRNTGGDLVCIEAAEKLQAQQHDDFIWFLFRTFQSDPKIKWKESIKKVVGLDLATVAGEDK